ncbi:MAG: hypothetical protein KC619_23205 [Myxococcales bacterium]|nr:hypothetical protein [Myxococcales bacterium]
MDAGELIVVLLGGTFTIGAVALAVFWEKKQSAKRHAIWRAIADRRGGRFTEGHLGAFQFETPVLDAVVGHAVVRLDLLRVQSGKQSHIHTRARARFALGAGPVFQVFREGFFQSVGKAFGGQDVVLGGDAVFDDAFIVKCPDAEATTRTWVPRAKHLMCRLDQPLATSDGTTIEVRIFDSGMEEWILNALLDLVGGLASAQAEPLGAYEALPDARLEPVDGPFEEPRRPRLVFDTARGAINAELLPSSGSPKLRLKAAHDRGVTPFSVDVIGGKAPGLPRGLVSVRADELLRRLDGVTLAGDAKSLQLTWPAAPAPAVVADGLAFLSELASGAPSEGAFR